MRGCVSRTLKSRSSSTRWWHSLSSGRRARAASCTCKGLYSTKGPVPCLGRPKLGRSNSNPTTTPSTQAHPVIGNAPGRTRQPTTPGRSRSRSRRAPPKGPGRRRRAHPASSRSRSQGRVPGRRARGGSRQNGRAATCRPRLRLQTVPPRATGRSRSRSRGRSQGRVPERSARGGRRRNGRGATRRSPLRPQTETLRVTSQ
mmetsp:Transcript_1449/g.2732  ORF Transcript_1449/g.2732 Transcript_1449/m.2732 type:complete len:201 (+) Transcript_1449:319-921(+)